MSSIYPRATIEQDYDVENGRIVSPGKFESEAVYAPYFYEAMLSGDGEELGDGELRFDVTDEDRREFPELKGVEFVLLSEDSNGFVYVTAVEGDAS
jgi:hypothetical protein